MLINKVLDVEFNKLVIIDIVATKCKICKLNRSMLVIELNAHLYPRESCNGKID